MRKTRTTEFKEMITNTLKKTVSAFLNYDGGDIAKPAGRKPETLSEIRDGSTGGDHPELPYH